MDRVGKPRERPDREELSPLTTSPVLARITRHARPAKTRFRPGWDLLSDPAKTPMRARRAAATLAGSGEFGCPARGEWEVRGDARAETRFHFRMGITSVVPWLVVSDSTRCSLVSSVLAGWPRWLPTGSAAEARFTRGRALSSSPSICPRRATRLACGGSGSVRRPVGAGW